MPVPKHILQLIDQGEGIKLDFKQTVSSYHKIAKSIVSFANTHGGTLLIGIADNKAINGIYAREEEHMLVHAIEFYCKPQPTYSIKQWDIGNKSILECIIDAGGQKPYYALDKEKKWWVHVRVADKCILASKTTVDFMRGQQSNEGVQITYGKIEQGILSILSNTEKATLKEISKKLNISYRRASRTLVELMRAGVVRSHTTEKTEFYTAV